MAFVPPVAVTVTLIDYLIAGDLLMNLEYKTGKLLSFSRTSIAYIHTHWGVPDPFNIVVFVALSFIAIYLTQKVISRFFRRGSGNQGNYKFNTPDFSEIGVLVNSVRKLHEELADIKKQLGVRSGTSNSTSQVEQKL